jgi:hypothetical protein
MNSFGKLIFWDFKRASWQYDVVVALILVFIFVIPREVFNDQPKAASIVMLPANQGYLLEPGLLKDVSADQRASAATELVRKRFKSQAVVNRVEPFYEEDKLTGYMAFTAQ